MWHQSKGLDRSKVCTRPVKHNALCSHRNCIWINTMILNLVMQIFLGKPGRGLLALASKPDALAGKGKKKNLTCFTPPMLTAECMSYASMSYSVLLCWGLSDLGVPEGAGASGQDGCNCGFFSVRFHRVLFFKKQSAHDGALLLCVLVLRWIFKDVHVQWTLRTKFLQTIFVDFLVCWLQ